MHSHDFLNIALIEYDIKWEDVVSNRNRLEEIISNLPENTDLVILPEMFTTGFSMHAEKLAESMDGTTVNWLKSLANKKQIAIAGSLIIDDNNSFFNRFVFVYPDKSIEFYDKRHLFSLAKEEEVYQKGTRRQTILFKDWSINLQVCYDLRFPVWSRNSDDYDMLIYVANWPQKRIKHWDLLLRARAIENMAYCIGVNRIGTDKNGHQYPGHSVAIDSKGTYLEQTNDSKEVKLFTLSKSKLYTQRQNFKFLNDRDVFNLEV